MKKIYMFCIMSILFGAVLTEGCPPTTTTTTTKPCEWTNKKCKDYADSQCYDLGVQWWYFNPIKCTCTFECKKKPTTTTTKPTTTTTKPTTTTTKCTTTTTEPEVTTTTVCTTTTTEPEVTTTSTQPETTTTTLPYTPPTTLPKSDRVVGQSSCVCGGHAPAINATPLVYWCHNPNCWCKDNYKECSDINFLPKGSIIKYFLDTCNCPISVKLTIKDDNYIKPSEDNCEELIVNDVCSSRTNKCYSLRLIKYFYPHFRVVECSMGYEIVGITKSNLMSLSINSITIERE